MVRPEKVTELKRFVSEQRRLMKQAEADESQPSYRWVLPAVGAVAGGAAAGGAARLADALHNKATLHHMPDHVFARAVKDVSKGFGFPAEVSFVPGIRASATPNAGHGAAEEFFRIVVPRKAPFEVSHEAGHVANYGLIKALLGGGIPRAANLTHAGAKLAPIVGGLWGFGSGYSGSSDPWHLYGVPAISNIPRLLNEVIASHYGLRAVNRLGARNLSASQRTAGRLGLAAQLGSYLGASAVYSLAPAALGSFFRWMAGR